MYTTASRRGKYKVVEVAKVRFSKFQLAKSGLNETTRSQQLHWLKYLFSIFFPIFGCSSLGSFIKKVVFGIAQIAIALHHRMVDGLKWRKN